MFARRFVRLSQLAQLAIFLGCLLRPLSVLAWEGKVVGVSDGDSITVLQDKNQVRVRLYGIDCPEKRQAFGTRAKQFTSGLVFGKVVDVETVDVDRYGRTVGIVKLPDGTVLNQELIRAGFAWIYTRYCKKPVCQEWKGLEGKAMAEKRGLWKDKEPVPPWEWRRQRRKR